MDFKIHAALTFFAFSLLVSCKPQSKSLSQLNDRATTKSFKSGIFNPAQIKSASFGSPFKVAPWTTIQFIEQMRVKAKAPNLQMALPEGGVYSVTANAQGEQLLSLHHNSFGFAPQYSISPDGSVYEWKKAVFLDGAETMAVPSKIFVKSTFGNTNAEMTVDNMYVMQTAASGKSSELVLIPWNNHLCSETANSCFYRLGNTIINSRNGVAAYRFEQLAQHNAWIITGEYKDLDLSAGSVIWQNESNSYYSTSYQSKLVTRWSYQDQDSLDRLDTVSADSVSIPPYVKTYLESLNAAASNPAANVKVSGFD
jgi:hypothetical protein